MIPEMAICTQQQPWIGLHTIAREYLHAAIIIYPLSVLGRSRRLRAVGVSAARGDEDQVSGYRQRVQNTQWQAERLVYRTPFILSEPSLANSFMVAARTYVHPSPCYVCDGATNQTKRFRHPAAIYVTVEEIQSRRKDGIVTDCPLQPKFSYGANDRE